MVMNKLEERLMGGRGFVLISLIKKEQAAIVGCKRVSSLCGALYYPGGRSRLVASVTGCC